MKETLEEAAERLVKETTLYGSQEAGIGSSARSYFETELRCVLLGMQWQKERSYSEEEALGFGKFCLNKVADFLNGKSDEEDGKEYSIEELFEQFKKK